MILILGGTAESRALASAMERPFTLSLAGVTRSPAPQSYPTRTGGFGGVSGLVSYIGRNKITALIDATHPFAARISQNAVTAAQMASIPLLRLERVAWSRRAKWQEVGNIAAAADALPQGARAFLTLGGKHLEPFVKRRDIWCLTRAIEPPVNAPQGKVLLQRPPFSLAHEMALMEAHRITHLVSKNSGGAQTAAKLGVAETLGLSVLMVKRPVLPLAETTDSLKHALQWIRLHAGQ